MYALKDRAHRSSAGIVWLKYIQLDNRLEVGDIKDGNSTWFASDLVWLLWSGAHGNCWILILEIVFFWAEVHLGPLHFDTHRGGRSYAHFVPFSPAGVESFKGLANAWGASGNQVSTGCGNAAGAHSYLESEWMNWWMNISWSSQEMAGLSLQTKDFRAFLGKVDNYHFLPWVLALG